MNLKIPLWRCAAIYISVKVIHKYYDFWNWMEGVGIVLDEVLRQSGGNEANWSSLDNATFIILLRSIRQKIFLIPGCWCP